jgi:LacI family transcriptional regulator
MDYVHGFQTGASEAGYATRIEFLRGVVSDWRRHAGGDGMAFLLNALPSDPLPEGPAVFIMGWTQAPCPIDWVHTDNAGGGRLAAEHLLALGHRRLACFMDHLYHDGVLLRAEAFRRKANEAGVEFESDAVPTRERPGTLEGLIDLLKRPDRPTGIFCTTDHAALRVVDAAMELGLTVPADLSVVGFDKSFFSELGRLPLTTIVSDRGLTGRRAAQALIDRIEGRYRGPAREIITPVTLWRGASTASCVG